MNIVVAYKFVWSKHLFYPLSEDAKLLARLIGCKALSRKNLRVIREFGWHIEIEQPNVDAIINETQK